MNFSSCPQKWGSPARTPSPPLPCCSLLKEGQRGTCLVRLLLVTDSIFDARKYVFKRERENNNNKQTQKKGIPPPSQKYSILKVKKASPAHCRSSLWAFGDTGVGRPPDLGAPPPATCTGILSLRKLRGNIGSHTVRFCFYTWKW